MEMWKIQEAVDYIEQTRTPRERYGKEKLEQALEMLGNPQKKLKFVHVAGTNGKCSTASMLACILSEAGYRTGLYTSPHLVRYHERMQVDGELISDEDLIRAAQKVQEVCAKLGNPPIVFEVLTLMALWYFAEKNCEIVVLEVGIGGRLDSTNVIDAPLAAVITQIGLDHTETLGNTIEQIAAEKGGIIKPGCEAVMAKQSPEAVQVVQELCRQQGVRLNLADPERLCLISESMEGQKLRDKTFGELNLALLGEHQRRNAANVLETVELLNRRGLHITEQQVRDGIAKSRWPARFELLRRHPDFILDGGHNPQCIQAAVDALRHYYPGRRVVFLVGMMADKDTERMLGELAQLAQEFVCVGLDSPRAMSAQQLCEELSRYQVPACACDTVPEAVQTAQQKAGSDGIICALGSLYLAGDIRAFLL